MQAHVDFVQYDKTIAELRNITSNLDATSRWRVFLVRLILTFKIISYCESLLDPCGGLRMKARAILVCSSVNQFRLHRFWFGIAVPKVSASMSLFRGVRFVGLATVFVRIKAGEHSDLGHVKMSTNLEMAPN